MKCLSKDMQIKVKWYIYILKEKDILCNSYICLFAFINYYIYLAILYVENTLNINTN